MTKRQDRRDELNAMRAVQADPRLAYVKGQTSCNRTACQLPLAQGERWWNTSTQAFYCKVCAMRINEGAPDLCKLETSHV